jgi:hypothetical protein
MFRDSRPLMKFETPRGEEGGAEVKGHRRNHTTGMVSSSLSPVARVPYFG